MKSCAILSSIASVLILSLSVSMLASSPSLPDCSKWLSNSAILPYDSENSQSIHTFITESGTMYANPEYVNKDACTRALHMHIDTLPERRRLSEGNALLYSISSTRGVICDATNPSSYSTTYTDPCLYMESRPGKECIIQGDGQATYCQEKYSCTDSKYYPNHQYCSCVPSKVLECKSGTQIGVDGATSVLPLYMISGSPPYAHKCSRGWSEELAPTKTCS